MRTWVARRGPQVYLQAAHLHTTRPSPSWIHLNTGTINVNRRKPVKPLALPKDWEPFSISDTLLDLDAYDAPGVRTFDEADEARQELKWSENPTQSNLKEALASDSTRFSRAHARHMAISKRTGSSGKWRVSDMDIIGAALYQEPAANQAAAVAENAEDMAVIADTAEPGNIASDLHMVLEQNGIPPLDTIDHQQMLEWLIQRQKEVRPFIVRSTDRFVGPIIRGSAAPYLSWKRHIAVIMVPKFGDIQLLTRNQAPMIHAFRSHFTSDRARDLLILLGNIRVRMEQEGLYLPGRLCQVGLALATIVGHKRAMQSYLNLCLVYRFKGISPDPSLYDVNALPSAIVRGPEGQAKLAETEYSIHKLIMAQGGSATPAEERLERGPETGQGNSPGPDEQSVL